ncbi:hypothetical protein ANOM_006835 [Aspergillus nomiae NRRL 13137]|uniref:Uncharacterized protein n=1 Tax=Aspergillus nomiae NRRL (strain ATCC 15546 / NRRL 13137 / CBS 260.88 / M93) TaxID=1509407 RepID=A0A0L1IZ39_ASPN3|nr:uncharacterized protein ANOM_006835 [Aspergillus nomiae NRRL 13137]KNG84779.1 hypothetical protein ANOM_006835 [Aspergillus nomiae NRRL 13137]
MTSSSAPSDNSMSNSNATSGTQGFTLHVLCPSLPPPNRFTFNDLVPSITIAGLKARISQSIPSRPSPETQRLIYRGKPISNDDWTLQKVLEPADGAEYSMHLVLPPAPLPPYVATSPRPSPSPQYQAPPGMPSPDHLFAPSRSAPPYPMQHGQEVRYRGSMGPSEADIGLALRRNIETIRRQIELRERGGSPLSDQQGTEHTQQFPWQRMTPLQSSTTTSTSTSTMSSHPSDLNASLSQDTRLRLHILRPQIALCEDQLNRGIAPPMDQVIRIRSQLFDILDDQYRNPLSERDGSIEALLTRVFNIYTRADQLRVSQSRATASMQHNTSDSPGSNGHEQASLYLLSSPSGYQALVTSPGAVRSIESSLSAFRSTHASQAISTHATGHPPQAHPNPNAAIMENAVRQAVLNQRLGNNEAGGFARSIRRIWLFVRLYFFCYMFSEPGTWSRVLLVTLAVIVSLLSETSVPRQLYGMIVSPIQRHLEGLIHFTTDEHVPPRPRGTDTTGSSGNAHQPGDNRAATPAGTRHSLRRVERSLALFIASLVPGVGERHVEVRNAAEAARTAERAREEEEERRRQEEASNGEGVTEQEQQDHEENPTSRPESSVTNPATEDGLHTSIPHGDEQDAR